jgi:hypothetical protein
MQSHSIRILIALIVIAGLIIITTCLFVAILHPNTEKNIVENQPGVTQSELYKVPLPTFKSMQFAWFYKPPENPAELYAVASNFSFFILTRNDEPDREKLAKIGAEGNILQYLRFEAVMDPGDCQTKPFQNQAANLEGDFCLIKEQHSDWFLKDINGNSIKFNDIGYVVMDSGNTGWQSFFLEKVKGFQKDPGWEGLFLDNLDASLGRFEVEGKLLTHYTDDKSYQDAVVDHLSRLSKNLHQTQHKLLFANITYLRQPEVWFRYLEYLDGAMLEAFAADWENGYLTESEWLSQLDLAEATQLKGKTIILVTQGAPDDSNRMLFGLASYLLVNNGQAYFRYTNDLAYRQVWSYPEFKIDLGQPKGPRYKESGIWKRDFENGSVSVDPLNHTGELLLK